MKLLIFLIGFTAVLFGCWKKPEQKIIVEKPIQERLKEYGKNELDGKKEKIFLLSEIYKISPDTIFLIITDYYTYNGDNYVAREDSSGKYSFDMALSGIAEKYSISKRRAASLIFSFVYEMQTKEDIINQYRDENGIEL